MQFNVGVRKLVEYVMMSGNLELDKFVSSSRAMAGIAAHKKIQKERGDDYKAEVSVSHQFKLEDINIIVSGRIDGVYKKENQITIEEIKSTTEDIRRLKLKKNEVHWGQAKVYAYLYSLEHTIDRLNIALVYYNIDDGKVFEINDDYTFADLEEFMTSLLTKYHLWARRQLDWNMLRDNSLKDLSFPYSEYRIGQREMAVGVYRALRDGGELLIQAPTGIGKTVATIFPALKILPGEANKKIFYLTARGTGKEAVEKAVKIINNSGGRVKCITLTAKEKICFNPGSACNGRECNFAKGYYDRVNDALEDIFQKDIFTREIIEITALKFSVCPFEFSLYLSLWCDIIISDYNYAFDPRVRLKRYFVDSAESKKSEYYFLVDEAHNLVDRSRKMFSAELRKDEILKLRRLLKTKQPELCKHLSAMNNWFLKARKKAEEKNDHFAEIDAPDSLFPVLRKFKRRADTWLAYNFMTDYRRNLLDFYFKVGAFLRISENYDSDYLTCYEKEGKDLLLKLFCLDPARSLKESRKNVKSVIFFSATLTPQRYYKELYGCESYAESLDLPSPFPKKNFFLAKTGISTRYKDRNDTLDNLVSFIEHFVKSRKGNFLLFFPSYKYLETAFERITLDNFNVIKQKSNMKEEERLEFMDAFKQKNDKSLIALAVMGGIFGEGIDLIGEKLEGAIIVGVGLPGIDFERDLIREYFQKDGKGYEFAYLYPGLTRVLQAAGRVIRSETDKGSVLLIDDRFSSYIYRKLLPAHWFPISVRDEKALDNKLNDFWMN